MWEELSSIEECDIVEIVQLTHSTEKVIWKNTFKYVPDGDKQWVRKSAVYVEELSTEDVSYFRVYIGE